MAMARASTALAAAQLWLAKTLLPPSFADFYLDANHPWEVRSFSSTTSCFDHIRYPLRDVVEATRYVETEQKVGNVVLVVQS